ncbi:hypothetical protein [Ochrobactrum sp. Marseille-Q0166]|uniref:hypothetical protein n=1 Tax=Ochrobactrum sp. Marseille-Q0166 TaxID=2761105 RepID=UPI001656061F|nr:hypothetical protein [Ochrobactrum sp. Marseille-Q0166]MBC8718169.1 hypothetical protein [Ochrobactrum sp. Marseille-Q0166]
MQQHNATFANFICRFGDDKVLLDYAYEIVIPAFTRDTFIRRYGATHYHLYDVELVTLDETKQPPIMALAGRFIKDTELRRYQIFDEKHGLVRDEQSMRSAPSAFFVLILNNHRMAYFPETPNAPDLRAFEVTVRSFLIKRYEEFINEAYELAQNRTKLIQLERKITKKALREALPRPTLEVVPLTGADSIEQFVRRYDTLKQIDFRIVRPNDDIDAGELFGEIRKLSESLNANRTKVTAANAEEGLDVGIAIETITEATATGNQDVILNGVDHEGNKLSGNNHNFQVSAPIEDVPVGKLGLAKVLYNSLLGLAASGTLRLPRQQPEQAEKMRNLVDRLN